MLSPAIAEFLPWHQQSYSHLCELNQKHHLAHAYLLHGPVGLGKLNLAKNFSYYLLCHSPKNFQPCWTCHACQLLSADTHPDLKLVVPEESRNIKIEQIRHTLAFMANTSQQGGRKIIIIAPAEAMNINASNALLKALEEPSDGTLILLVSHQPSLLMATIRSRCQKVQLVCPDISVASHWLESKQVKESPQRLLKLANGAPLRALQLADDDLLHERQVLYSTLLGLLNGSLSVVQASINCGVFNIQDNIESMMLSTTDLLAFYQSKQQHELRDGNLLEIFNKLYENANVIQLHHFYQALLLARQATNSTSNPNPQLILESLFYQWSELSMNLSSSSDIRQELPAL